MPNKTKADISKEVKKLLRENKDLKSKLALANKASSIHAQNMLGEIFENAGLAICLTDPAGKLLKVNSILAKMLGYSKKELLLKTIHDITPSPGSDIENNFLSGFKRGNKRTLRATRKFTKKKGSVIWGKLTSSSIKEGKTTKYLIHIIEDISEQIETQEKLSLEQKLLNALMQHIPDSIYFKDINSKFIRVNSSKAKKHGFKKETDLIGKSDFDLYVQSHAIDAFNDEKEIIKSGKPIINKEEKIDWKNGRTTWASTTKMPLIDDDGKISGTFGITRDISDRVKYEHGLKESEEKYRTLFENSKDGILMFTDVLEDCNPAALKLFNATREQLLGLHPSDLCPETQMDGTISSLSINEKISNALNGEPQKFFWQFKALSGDLIETEVSFNSISIKGKRIIQASLRDISEQINSKKIENAVYKISEAAHTSEDIEKLYKRIHEIISELMPAKNFYISLYDERKNILSFPYFVDEFDPPQPSKKFGKGLTEYILRKNEAMLINAKKDLELRESGEVELIGAPQAIWLGIPLKLRGKTLGVMVVQNYEDESAYGESEKNLLTFVSEQITQAIERKKNTEAIKIYAEELMQLNKTKDKFFSILAHDLRNPFITILGFSDLLLSDFNDLTDEERLFYVEEMKKSAEISHSLLQNLLQWSRSQTGRLEFHPSNCNLKNIIYSNFELSKVQAEKKGISLTTNVKDDIYVYADEDMITTVIRNLLTNAIKFTNSSGEVKLDTAVNEHNVHISVRDNGIGMDDETISNLFRLDVSHSQPGTNNEGGTGLGLILCKEFVEKNGGTLTVTSKPNEGSTFSFSLPRSS